LVVSNISPFSQYLFSHVNLKFKKSNIVIRKYD